MTICAIRCLISLMLLKYDQLFQLPIRVPSSQACAHRAVCRLASFDEPPVIVAAQILSGLVHERIICLLGACTSPPHLAIVEELAEKSLHAELHRRADGSERAEPAPMPYPRVGSCHVDSWCMVNRHSSVVCWSI